MPKPAIIRLDPRAPTEPWPDYPESEISSGDRASRGHFWFDDSAAGLKLGVWEAEANLGRWMSWPVHEFMIILDGEVVVIEADRETVVGPGESFFIPKGRRCIWNQAGRARKFMLLYDGPGSSAETPIFKINPRTALEPAVPPAAQLLDSAIPVQQAHEYFADASGRFTVGVWQTTAYRRKLIDFPRHELMHLLEGSVTFTGDNGVQQTFTAGDTFFVPLGTPNAWTCEGPVKKIYCILQPKG